MISPLVNVLSIVVSTTKLIDNIVWKGEKEERNIRDRDLTYIHIEAKTKMQRLQG